MHACGPLSVSGRIRGCQKVIRIGKQALINHELPITDGQPNMRVF